ncbi:hypothetical protein IQ254_14730 [Nodosilinea sp. LEGE 07088]|uniref:hypothetical protein n=1 Tax=Nodosilinea sp. LEGE 07088 TaxID=2777968 RepID=UPI00187F8B4C|nr:hypothetical protein [Nodosilinea sp. LEGE 07088]MBE9138428.1 hypothetical protein [Nodosilinea sp. LEGE 07088]
MTVALEFASSEDLRTALGRWLEDYGHDVHRQVPCPGEGVVDLLTPLYAIFCPSTLLPADLWAAVDVVQLQQANFPEQQMVIAGLTPDSDWEAVQAIAEQIKPQGIEVWLLDQNSSFVEFYARFTADPLPQPEGKLTRRNPLAGCLISLGMAAILSVSFWLAYRILDRHQLQVATNSQDNRTWEQLHSAVGVWDMESTLASLESLGNSRNPCVVKFAEQFEASLQQNGAEGFRDINPIKRALNLQEGCDLDMREYDFSQ